MKPVAVFPDPLTTELVRLLSVESQAFAQHNVPVFIHSRLRWCELILTQCPGLSAAAPVLSRKLNAALPRPAAPLPRWKVELRARPLVRIVERKLKTITYGDGASYRTAFELLACGHTLHVLLVMESDLRARRRRCKECGAARLTAMERHDTSIPVVPAANAAVNPVEEGGFAGSPEPLHGAAAKQPRPCLVTPH